MTVAFICWLLCSILFLSGAVIKKLGCDTLEDPEASEVYEMIEDDLNRLIHDTLDNPAFDAGESYLGPCWDTEPGFLNI